MTIAEILHQSPLARLDTEVLLAHVLQNNRTWLITHDDDALSEEQLLTYRTYEQRRQSGEPIAYITGEKEFYGHLFHVAPGVLIPRPSTEGLIDTANDFLKNPQTFRRSIDEGIEAIAIAFQPENKVTTIVDIGTGSGCIAIILAKMHPHMKLIATDISPNALTIAKKNAEEYALQQSIQFLLGKNVEPVMHLTQPFLIVSNPPYIPSTIKLESTVADFEPHEALFAGEDGLSVLRELVMAAKTHPQCVGIVLECRADQSQKLIDMAR
ncbi:MAG: peptide chain release factor N(5)-glutamine methyltransferase [Candidatus Peribacteraceae bacterium]|nr:peptide chain release factor N(5)-glutamine methyltransferase [Candidatus Peribacteraceae bacterium]